MTDNITAKDLMRPSFVQLEQNNTLRQAMRIALDNQYSGEPDKILVVLNEDSSFSGILTTRNLLRCLMPDDITNTSAHIPDKVAILQAMHNKLNQSLRGKITPNIPPISPETRLPTLIKVMQDQYLEVLPVVQQQKLVGVIYLTDVFKATCDLALATQESN